MSTPGNLIRDNMVELRAAKGEKHNWRPCDDDREYWILLAAKLTEEDVEVRHAMAHTRPGHPTATLLGELADVLAVVESIANAAGSNLAEVVAVEQAKRAVRGGYGKRIIWEGPADDHTRAEMVRYEAMKDRQLLEQAPPPAEPEAGPVLRA